MYDPVNFDIVALSSHIGDNRLMHLAFPTELWESFNADIKAFLRTNNWSELKYLDDNSDFDPMVANIPNTQGGIYCFYINSEILPTFRHAVLCYVGRAHKPDANNLQKRIKEYRNYEQFPEEYERPKLRKLFGNWGKYIHCRYLPISNERINGLYGDQLIDAIEAELINKIIPPCNSKIPDINISNATARAFA